MLMAWQDDDDDDDDDLKLKLFLKIILSYMKRYNCLQIIIIIK